MDKNERFWIGTTRFTNYTYKENQDWRERFKWKGCIYGLNKKMPARSAALMNGVASHALDYDDTNFLYLGHPSVVVNSAVFAAANQVGLSLNSSIVCALIGCEVSSRVGVWLFCSVR